MNFCFFYLEFNDFLSNSEKFKKSYSAKLFFIIGVLALNLKDW